MRKNHSISLYLCYCIIIVSHQFSWCVIWKKSFSFISKSIFLQAKKWINIKERIYQIYLIPFHILTHHFLFFGTWSTKKIQNIQNHTSILLTHSWRNVGLTVSFLLSRFRCPNVMVNLVNSPSQLTPQVSTTFASKPIPQGLLSSVEIGWWDLWT